MARKISQFDILKQMSQEDNKNFKLFPSENVMEYGYQEDNDWGYITMAVDKGTIEDMLKERPIFVGLFVYDIDDFYRIKAEMEGE